MITCNIKSVSIFAENGESHKRHRSLFGNLVKATLICFGPNYKKMDKILGLKVVALEHA
jgi:hypothetical protein